MKDIKAFENAVASARVHVMDCENRDDPADSTHKCWTCNNARALIDAHVDLERYRMMPQLLARCDLGHVFVNKYRIDGECPYCNQLMARQKWALQMQHGLREIREETICSFAETKAKTMLAITPDAPGVVPQLQYVGKMLRQLIERTSDPALKKYLDEEIMDPLRKAVSGVTQ